MSWNLAGISLWDGRASKVLEDWASDPWMRWDQSGPLGGLIPVRASPTLAVGEDEEGGERGGEGCQGEDEQGLEDLEAELQEEQHQRQAHRRSHRDGDPLRGAQVGEHGWRGVSLSGY